MSDTMGKLLSERGTSYCTYTFSGPLSEENLKLTAAQLAGQLRKNDPKCQIFFENHQLVIKLDHALGSAQQ